MIFVSYSRRNQSLVHPLVQFLRASGHEVFVDVQDLSHGDDWHANLMQAIDRSDRFLIFWSREARDSRVVGEEWQRAALNQKRRIIPVLLDQTPLPPELERFHGLSELAEVFQGMIRARKTTRWLWWTWAVAGPALGSLAVLFMLWSGSLGSSPLGVVPRDLTIGGLENPADVVTTDDYHDPPVVESSPLDALTPWLSWQLLALGLALVLIGVFWVRHRRLTRRAAELVTA